MPQTITNEDGSTQEVFTAEELETQKTEALEAYKKENPDKTEEITKMQNDLKVAQDALGKLNDKDLNFANLKAGFETKIKSLETEMSSKIEGAKKEVLEGVLKDHYNETLSTLAGGDEELKKKIELQYKRLGDSAATKEELSKKLIDAFTLASKPVEAPYNAAVFSSGGASKINPKGSASFTPEEKAFAQKLANAGNLGKLEDKDFK